jgi:hypothetical protein
MTKSLKLIPKLMAHDIFSAELTTFEMNKSKAVHVLLQV